MRLGIAGGGVAGLALAWLLETDHDVVLLEKRDRLGGNTDTRSLQHGGRAFCVDLGVREVPDDRRSLWHRISRLTGFLPERSPVPASRTVFRDPRGTSVWSFAGKHGGAARYGPQVLPARDVLERLVEQCALLEAQNSGWNRTLGALLAERGLSGTPAAQAVCALPASVHGCTLDEALSLSARSVGPLLSELGPEDGRPAYTSLVAGGAGGLSQALAGDLRTASIRLGVALRRLVPLDRGPGLVGSDETVHPVDAVALALPAESAKHAVGALPGAERVHAALARVPYRDLLYGLHTDPFGMPADRRAWSVSNVALHAPWAETTTWLGPALGPDLFVSQLTRRRSMPRLPLMTSRFRTRLPTPAAHRAVDRLAAAQGEGHLFFAGHCATHDDSQESALASAVAVAEQLAPDSPRLRRLRETRKEATR
ncbi:FAD-dependent oxidoreductase [Streptomyces albus subsp. chlorinus]|uniref:FAD-dependent oxidoreductase n=1 Tax=Streptomyces albus TaxID=1888 RepID=UPI00156DDB32|nr:FAD-dependent oxidoreductase [Streptomyces albus]